MPGRVGALGSFQKPTNNRHAEAWVIYIGIAGDHNDVATIPAKRVHFRPGGGQFRCRAKTFGPVFSVRVDGCRHGLLHEKWKRIIAVLARPCAPDRER